MNDFRELELGTLGNGAAAELFGVELERTLDNIRDPNTEPKVKRKIVLEVEIAPNETREIGMVDIKCYSKLPGYRSAASAIQIVTDEGRWKAFEPKMAQQEFSFPQNVTGLDRAKEATND